MSCDAMGPKGRAWALAGGEWFHDPAWREPVMVAFAGMPPVLILPATWVDHEDGWWRIERAFGWALAELYQRRRGWLALVGHIRCVAEHIAIVALPALASWLLT